MVDSKALAALVAVANRALAVCEAERDQRGPMDVHYEPEPAGKVATDLEAALEAIERAPKPLPMRSFMRGGFSIRPTVRTYTGLPDRMTYGVWPKGQRDHWAKRGDISETHGGCFTTWLPNEPVDAFHTFEEALAHVLEEARP